MTVIKMSMEGIAMEQQLRQFAEQWNLALSPADDGGFHLMPEYMMGIHGIRCEMDGREWRFYREQDATSWEDFLLMHLTHTLADQHNKLLYYEFASGSEQMAEPDALAFLTFDDYAEYVTQNEAGIVKDMKKTWLYTHQKRHVR